jgi:glycosyltransferase involved in cell wall biosynthesis
MSRGIEKYGYRPVLILHKEAQDSSLLIPEEREQAYFLPLPRARRRQSIGYCIRYFLQNIQSIYKFTRVIRKEQASLVHINEILDLYAAVPARLAGVPCVWHIRADLPGAPWSRWFLPRIVNFLSERVIAPSKSVQKRMFEEQGIPTDKVVVIHTPGPDLERFHPRVEGAAIREELNLEEGCFVVSLVGKLVELKGHKTLLRAAPIILESFPNTYFLLVGAELAGRHKEYAHSVKALPKELGIGDRVIFTGFRSDVPQIMAASDVITHCSTYPDPFPGVVLQAMAVGKPVVAANLGGAPEQIKHGVSGILVEPKNSEALARAICSLLADSTKRVQVGQAAANRVRSKFASEQFFLQLANLYGELISTQSP